MIPLLDLNNLPPDSDDEAAAPKQKSAPVDCKKDNYLEEQLGHNQMGPHNLIHMRKLSVQNDKKSNNTGPNLSQSMMQQDSGILDLSRFNQSGIIQQEAASRDRSHVMDIFVQSDALGGVKDNDL